MNMRSKFTNDMLNFCKGRIKHLNDWERLFINSVIEKDGELSSGQFNKLESIFQDLRKKGL